MRLDSSHAQFAGFFAVGMAIITTTVATFPETVRDALAPNSWERFVALAVVALGAVVFTAWLARLLFILGRAALTVERLPRVERMPARLQSSLARTGVERVECISSSLLIAFCTGARRPSIIVSEGLAEQLTDNELEAVLIHERQHLREREPVVRAACEAAAQVLVFFPLARWWSRRRMEAAELRADQAALRRVGARPVAAALFRLGTIVPAAPAFAGDTEELRVAQLLGDPLPQRRPTACTIATSMVGFPVAVATIGCLILILGLGQIAGI
jgi:Zn-dependent protease with chaperone function